MASISREEVLQIASLARLKLNEIEVALFQEQLGKILDHFKALEEVDTTSLASDESGASGPNVLRDDEPRPSISVEDALKNAPEQQDGFFVVPKVLDRT